MGVRDLVEEAGSSQSYRSSQHGGDRKTITATTVPELWQQALKLHGDGKCLGVREQGGGFMFMSYKEIGSLVQCSSSILWQFKRKQKTETACIWGTKCPAWMVSFLACSKTGLACIPIDSEMPSHVADSVIQDSKPFIIFSHRDCLIQIAKTLQRNPKTVNMVIYWGEECQYYLPEMQELRDANVIVYHMSEFLEMGEVYKKMIFEIPEPNTVLMVKYTLNDKGKVATHRFTHADFVAGLVSSKLFYEERQQAFTSDDTVLSSLSLDEAGNLSAELLLLHCGASIGYCPDFAPSLLRDAKNLQPTAVLSNSDTLSNISKRIKAHMLHGGGGGLPRLMRKFFFHWGFKRKSAFLKHGLAYEKASPVFDAFVRHELGNFLGGKLRMVISCGSALPVDNKEILEVVTSCAIHQLHSAPCLPAMSFFYATGFVSKDSCSLFPLPLINWCLKGVEKSMKSESPVVKGELAVSFQPQAETPCSFIESRKPNPLEDDQEWRYTGAIAELQEDGNLKLVKRRQLGRCMTHNEKSLQFIEQVYRRSPLVRDITVHQDGDNGVLTAEVFPDFSPLREWAKQHGLEPTAKPTIDHPDIISETLESLNMLGKKAGLRGNEKLDKVTVINWTQTTTKYDAWIDSARKVLFKNDLHRSISSRYMSTDKKPGKIGQVDVIDALMKLIH